MLIVNNPINCPCSLLLYFLQKNIKDQTSPFPQPTPTPSYAHPVHPISPLHHLTKSSRCLSKTHHVHPVYIKQLSSGEINPCNWKCYFQIGFHSFFFSPKHLRVHTNMFKRPDVKSSAGLFHFQYQKAVEWLQWKLQVWKVCLNSLPHNAI